MEIIQVGMAGTLESSDIQVIIEPNPSGGVDIQLNSQIQKQFGRQILEAIEITLKSIGVTDASVTANDKGALDYAVIARTEAAAYRGAGIQEGFDWGGVLDR